MGEKPERRQTWRNDQKTDVALQAHTQRGAGQQPGQREAVRRRPAGGRQGRQRSQPG